MDRNCEWSDTALYPLRLAQGELEILALTALNTTMTINAAPSVRRAIVWIHAKRAKSFVWPAQEILAARRTR